MKIPLFFVSILFLTACADEESSPEDTHHDTATDPTAEHDAGDLSCHEGVEDMSGQQAHEYDLVEWHSEDGTHWTEKRLFQACADVSSLASDGAGTVIVAFQNFQNRGDDSRFDKVALRRSSDGGVSWDDAEPANLIGLPPEAARPFDPTVVWDPSGSQWRLYFSMSMSGSMELDENVCTHSAVSENGVDFMYETGERFCDTGRPVIDPAVGLLDGIWYYSAPRGAPQEGAHLASSPDGLNFTAGPDVASDANHAWTGNFVEVDGVLRFYGREGLYPDGNVLWWSSTTDGITWSDYTQTDIPAGKDPGLLRREDGSFVILVPTPMDAPAE